MKKGKAPKISGADVVRKTGKYASKKLSLGVMAFAISVMAAVVAKGMALDKEDAKKQQAENEDSKESE